MLLAVGFRTAHDAAGFTNPTQCCMQESARHRELAKHRTAAVLKREQDKAAKGNTLDKIAEKFKEGPLLLLRRYYNTSVRLQVVTRHASGVRGTAVGEACTPLCNNTNP